jgi:hypothetical protein
MTLVHKSLHLKLPAAAPFDNEDALLSFAGQFILPFSEYFHWFWFSRYGSTGAWEVRFRFSTEDFPAVEPHFDYLKTSFAHGADGCGDYDYEGDLGGQRFLGEDAPDQDKAVRAGLVYDFLTSAARLTLASLVDAHNGRWRLEHETRSKLNRETSLESMHHLFCNMTCVPTWAAILLNPQSNSHRVVSDLDSRQIMKKDPKVQLVDLPKIQH